MACAWVLMLLVLLFIVILGVPSHVVVTWANGHLPKVLQLQNPQGLWWKGQAQWPWAEGWLRWQVGPQGIWLTHPALAAPLHIGLPTFMRYTLNGELPVPAGALRVDAAVLKYFHAAAQALRPAGTLHAQWQICFVAMTHKHHLSQGEPCQGDIMWRNAQLRVSPVNPLGEYQLTWIAHNGGDELALRLQTNHGPLMLNGQGQWQRSQGLQLTGQAWANAGHHEPLKPLLAMIGTANPETNKTDWLVHWNPGNNP